MDYNNLNAKTDLLLYAEKWAALVDYWNEHDGDDGFVTGGEMAELVNFIAELVPSHD